MDKKKIRVGFIGMGRRAPGMVKTALMYDYVDVTSICDIDPDRITKGQQIVKEVRDGDCKGYTDYKELLADTEIDAVIITAAWEVHVPMAVAAMKAGKAVGLEVGGAYSVDDCWELVKTYEETKTPFMFLENCCYGKRELLATSLVRNGVLGEIVYCHGAYAHDLRKGIAEGVYTGFYRLRNYLTRNCENYPTHELGPIAKILNINRGNRMLCLVSVASKARGMHAFVDGKEAFEVLQDKSFIQGDIVETIITCADGATISLKLDTTLPRYYSRELTVSGTKGLYKEEGDVVFEDGDEKQEGEELDSFYHSAENYEDKYLPDCWKKITPEEVESGHGGMDVLVLGAFFEALQNGTSMPIDVYDAASWMVISCLSETSVRMGGHPVEIPDFTRGAWLTRKPKDVIELAVKDM